MGSKMYTYARQILRVAYTSPISQVSRLKFITDMCKNTGYFVAWFTLHLVRRNGKMHCWPLKWSSPVQHRIVQQVICWKLTVNGYFSICCFMANYQTCPNQSLQQLQGLYSQQQNRTWLSHQHLQSKVLRRCRVKSKKDWRFGIM